jgi:hypothetical protein
MAFLDVRPLKGGVISYHLRGILRRKTPMMADIIAINDE